MFNRKITSESFDDSLDNLEDFFQDPLATKDLSNKSAPKASSTVDLETGEVLSSPPRSNSANHKQQLDRSTSRLVNKSSLSQSEPLTNNLSVLISISASFFFSLVIFVFAYVLYSSEFSKLSHEIGQTSAKISALDQSITNLQTVSSTNDETDEVLIQLENLSNDLENIENTLENHLQTTKKIPLIVSTKKASPSDSLKNVSYLGFFGTIEEPIALISVKDEKKELKRGQLLIDYWHLTAIHSHYITLSHITGMVQNITRKKPLF